MVSRKYAMPVIWNCPKKKDNSLPYYPSPAKQPGFLFAGTNNPFATFIGMRWRNITLHQFQIINDINDNQDFDELDKLLHISGVLFDKTETQLVQIGADKCRKLISKTEALFKKDFPNNPHKRIGIYRIEYEIERLRFGQFVELVYFTTGNIIDNAAEILASVAHLPFMRNDSTSHRKRSAYFLHRPVTEIVGSLAEVVESFSQFCKEYPGLFDLPEDGEEQEVKEDPFNRSFGWIYSATQVAEHERITLEQAYNLPVRQAMNDLAFLKAKQEYDRKQIEKHGKHNIQ